MELHSNNRIRDFVMSMILFDNTYQDAELDEGTRCHLCAEKIQMLSSIPSYKELYETIIDVIFLDAYKALNLKERELSINYDERDLLDLINRIGTTDFLKDAIENDKFLLEELIEYFLDFYRMNPFRKIISYGAIDQTAKIELESDFKEFKNDIEEYHQNLNLDLITTLSKEQMDSFQNIEDASDAYAETLANLIGFFKNLYRDNIIAYERIIKEMIELDYNWIKYVMDKNYECAWLLEDEMEFRIQKYEEFKIDELVEDTVQDDEYLEEIIDSFLSIKCDNMGMDEEIINEKLVEEHNKNKNRIRE